MIEPQKLADKLLLCSATAATKLEKQTIQTGQAERFPSSMASSFVLPVTVLSSNRTNSLVEC
jgi:hypothetical protein